MNETLAIIKRRRSLREFLTEQIKDADLAAVLEAGTYAPTAANQQPWHFTVIQNAKLLQEMSDDLIEHLQAAGDPRFAHIAGAKNFHVFHRAPTAVLISGEESALMPQADCAAAAQNMLLAAESLGLGSCWVNLSVHLFAGEKSGLWKQRLGVPDGYRPMYSIALGCKASEREAAPRREGVINYIK
ncbi:MAG: nitroreductase family protein [Bacillota bacterium]|nr:nitroreductase family protein [Bacillota bacterium]MDW7682769.1 nitroreductase family protein [Bacillota bacterium]